MLEGFKNAGMTLPPYSCLFNALFLPRKFPGPFSMDIPARPSQEAVALGGAAADPKECSGPPTPPFPWDNPAAFPYPHVNDLTP